MPKNTRNVTFPVEQGMYERLQAFKKAPGLGEAARRALQYLIDHPNEVLDPKPKGSPTMQQKPELKDEPGKKGVQKKDMGGVQPRHGKGRISRTDRSNAGTRFMWPTGSMPTHQYHATSWTTSWDLIRAEYPAILERRRKEKCDAELARIKAEEDRQKAIQAKAEQEKRAIRGTYAKRADVIRDSKSDMSIGRNREAVGSGL